jgi:hypothetical protein
MDNYLKNGHKKGRGFLLKSLFFCIPILIILAFPIWALWASGELMPADAIVSLQASSTGEVLQGLSYSNPICYLDLHLDIAKDPDILVLGSSRVQEFRSTFFSPGVSVFTAPTCVQKIGHLKSFLDDIPADKTPKVILLGLDQKFFNPNYDDLSPDNIDDLLTKPAPLLDPLSKWFEVYRDYLRGKFSITSLVHATSSRIGFWAISYGTGFRDDGSYDPGKYPIDDSTLSWIAAGTNGFQYSNAVSQGALSALDSLLAQAKARDIKVIGFMPAFSPAAYQQMVSMPNRYGYLKPLPAAVSAVFKKYNFSFYDFTDPASVGITQKEMIDGFHSTERGSLLEFEAMVESDPVLGRYADYSTIKQVLASTSVEVNIFPERMSSGT